MNAKDLEEFGLNEEQLAGVLKLHDVTVEQALMGSEARAEEAYQQLRDASERLRKLEAERGIEAAVAKFKPRDASVVARLIDPEKDAQKQLVELRKSHAYLFEGAGERGGAELSPAPAAHRLGMNELLRGE